MSKFFSLMLTTAFILLSFTTIFADQVTLKSGDRLTGKIIKQDDEKIVLQTEFAGVITILKTSVEKISIEETTAKEITAANINNVQKQDGEAGEPDIAKTNIVTAIETTVAAANVPKRRGLSFTNGWDGAANLGFSFTSGNSKTATFTAGIRAEKTSAHDKWTTYLNSLWNRNRVAGVNLTTSNAVWGGIRYDRNLTKRVFAFGSYDFERDEPQLLNFRSVLGAGLGYHAIKNDRTELDIFSGAAWNRSWYVGPNTSAAEALIGDTLKHKFNDRLKLQQGFTFYPNLTNGGEYRMIYDSTLSADVTKRIGWFVTLADRFNSAPVLGAQKNDFLFSTGLKWAFGKTK